MEDLALEVREVDDVGIDDPEGAHAGRREIEGRRRAETACADQQHLRAQELLLPRLPHLGEHEVAAVALHLLRGEGFVLHERVVELLPAADAARHRRDVPVAEIVEHLGGQEGAEAG